VRELESGERVAPHVIRVKIPWSLAALAPDVALKNLKRDILVQAIDFIEAHRFGRLGRVVVRTESAAFIKDLQFDATFGRFEKDFRAHDELRSRQIVRQGCRRMAEHAATPRLDFIAVVVRGDISRETLLHFDEIKPRLYVGRAADNDLHLGDRSVDVIHAVLTLDHLGRLFISDANSSTGTFVGVNRVAYGQIHEVKRGTEVRFGNTVVRFSKTRD
jgi:hypothetical protein